MRERDGMEAKAKTWTWGSLEERKAALTPLPDRVLVALALKWAEPLPLVWDLAWGGALPSDKRLRACLAAAKKCDAQALSLRDEILGASRIARKESINSEPHCRLFVRGDDYGLRGPFLERAASAAEAVASAFDAAVCGDSAGRVAAVARVATSALEASDARVRKFTFEDQVADVTRALGGTS